jgi:hypothetical protein
METNEAPTVKRKRRKTNKEKETLKYTGYNKKMGHTNRHSFDCVKNPQNMVRDKDIK